MSPLALETVHTIGELRAIGLPNFDAGQNGPPARVPGLLRKLNGQLRTLITDALNDRSRPGVANEKEIIAELREAGWKEIPSYKWNAYGEISQIRFDTRAGYDPGILVVSTQLWVPCGSSDPDTSIYVFEGRAREWKLVLATDADFDPADDRERNGMQYELSPQDANGSWYLAVAQTPPACGPTPATGSLRYKILRPGRSPFEETYRLVMPHANQILHGTIGGLSRHFDLDQDEHRIAIPPSDDWCGEALIAGHEGVFENYRDAVQNFLR